jgi:hypothetical protein
MSPSGYAPSPSGFPIMQAAQPGKSLVKDPSAPLPGFLIRFHSVTMELARHLANRLIERGFPSVADTKKIEDKAERKKVKRAARKKAAPKAKRTTPRGSNKKKVKKMVRGQSKR